jgi:hypothetical protein
MRIAIDISQIVYGTGVSVYTKNLVENLLRIDKEGFSNSADTCRFNLEPSACFTDRKIDRECRCLSYF